MRGGSMPMRRLSYNAFGLAYIPPSRVMSRRPRFLGVYVDISWDLHGTLQMRRDPMKTVALSQLDLEVPSNFMNLNPQFLFFYGVIKAKSKDLSATVSRLLLICPFPSTFLSGCVVVEQVWLVHGFLRAHVAFARVESPLT
jgi:hypothetical protein